MRRRPLRALHIIGTGRAGGVETFALLLSRHLDPDRVQTEVCILGSGGFIADALVAQRTLVHVLDDPKGRTRLAAQLFGVLAHGHFDLLHSSAGGSLPRFLAKLTGCAVLSHIHGPLESWASAFARGEVPARDVRRAFISGADRVAACSRSVSAAFAPYCRGDNPIVITPGVDSRLLTAGAESRTRVRQNLRIAEQDFVAAFAGRLVPQKGVAHLIEAARLLRRCPLPITFLVVGDGPLRQSLELAAQDALPGSFRFVGEQSNVPEFLAAADVLVVPSEWEPFGIVNLEAMAVARPVVAFAVGGITEIVRHTETGLLVPHRDVTALAQAIEQIAALPDRGASMGAAGRLLVQRRWDIRTVARNVEQLYAQMVRR